MTNGNILVFGNLRDAPDVAAQPNVDLSMWRVVESAAEAERHLIGILSNGVTLRCTTPIKSLDPARRKVITSSGRTYQLIGPPAADSELVGAILMTARLNGIGPTFDVTDLCWEAIQSATH
jgi:hypothetical protein